MNLEDIFRDESCSDKCNGCSILKKQKPQYCILDYPKMEPVDILFLSDSVKWLNGDPKAFRQEEEDLIIECIHPMYDHIADGLKIDFAAAVKCPNVVEDDLLTEDRKICRQHLHDTIEKLRPKLVYACGNLAMRQIINKSGLTGKNAKRGRTFEYQHPSIEDLRTYVVPLFHPFAVVQEPKNRYLFEIDIRNGYRKHILNIVDTESFSFTGIHSIDQIEDYKDLLEYKGPLAIDIETTGLDFRRDLIQSIAFSYFRGDKIVNICFPIDHKYTPFDAGEREQVIHFIRSVLANPDIIQVFQNGHFDRKFMKRYAIETNNTMDTKLMSKMVNEDSPNDLQSMVREHFADELEKL